MRLGEADTESVDAIVVAAPSRQVPQILETLRGRDTSRLTLMLDTPVLEPRDIGARRAFTRFKHVLASEDCFALPHVILARRLLLEGAIGRLRRVYLFHGGYRHHALSSLKQLTGARQPVSIAIHRWSPMCADVEIAFRNGVRATIVEPRRYDAGRMMVVGSSRFLTDYPIEHKEAVQIGYRIVNGQYVGLSVDGIPEPPSERDTALAEGLATVILPDPSLMSHLKIRGFMELLAALPDERSPYRYPADDAILDNLTFKLAERFRRVRTVPLGTRTTILGQLVRVASGFVPARTATNGLTKRAARGSGAGE
jgi:hypothetical protein